MYWRFFMGSKSTGTDAGWRWELCRDDHVAYKTATREFGTLTECMRDAAEHGYHGWTANEPGAELPLQDQRIAMASAFMPSSSFVTGGQRVN